MNFDLTEEQRILRDSLRDFCAREIIPPSRKWDEEERFPQEIVGKLAELGLLGMRVPESYGGAGMSMMDYVIAMEEIARADGSVALTDRKSTRLNSSHLVISYAVFCLKKKIKESDWM